MQCEGRGKASQSGRKCGEMDEDMSDHGIHFFAKKANGFEYSANACENKKVHLRLGNLRGNLWRRRMRRIPPMQCHFVLEISERHGLTDAS